MKQNEGVLKRKDFLKILKFGQILGSGLVYLFFESQLDCRSLQ